MVDPIEPPASHYLLAAQGWTERGNYPEAEAELRQLPAELRAHPQVLTVRYEIYAKTARWELAAEVAGILVESFADQAGTWVSLAYATRRKPGNLYKGIPWIYSTPARRSSGIAGFLHGSTTVSAACDHDSRARQCGWRPRGFSGGIFSQRKGKWLRLRQSPESEKPAGNSRAANSNHARETGLAGVLNLSLSRRWELRSDIVFIRTKTASSAVCPP